MYILLYNGLMVQGYNGIDGIYIFDHYSVCTLYCTSFRFCVVHVYCMASSTQKM